MEHRGDWLGSLSLFCTLMLTLLTTDFKDRFSVPKSSWLLVFSVITALSGIWLARTLYSRLSIRIETVDEMIQKFKNLPLTPLKPGIWQRLRAYYSRSHH